MKSVPASTQLLQKYNLETTEKYPGEWLLFDRHFAHILFNIYLSLFTLGESTIYRASERLSVGTDAVL